MPSRGKRGGGGGRGRGSSRGRGGGGGRGRGGGGGGGNRDRWGAPRAEIVKSNPKFENYYNELDILPDEDERKEFWDSLKSELPNSFRFTGSKGHALTVQKRLVDHYIPEITSVEYDGQLVEPPKPIEWYPDQLAWAMTTPKNVIRKFPPFASFQKFLVSENSVGNITRQEIVSMIPPLVMDIQPGMTVLDLCAAPGSKSAQLIEMVHGGEEARVRRVQERLAKEEGKQLAPKGSEVKMEEDHADTEEDYEDDGRATGLLIANDVDYKRAQMLVHQCKRLNSPNLIVTNHDATMFPSIKIPSPPGAPHRYLKFDRILADVPCSGDGTCRKNPEIWKEWAPSKGLGLHLTQVRILVRSLQMLKVGGRVVFSTCSMNPIENEAVVAAAIERCGGVDKVKLLDQTNALPGMKRRPGLKTWKVMDKAGRWWNSWEDIGNEDNKDDGMLRVVSSMFPPTLDPAELPPLENCMRVYPHLQNTGGFFIAVLEKQTEIRAKQENETSKRSTNTAPKVKSETPSIMNVVNELESKTANGGELEPIQALDAVLPPSVDPENDMDQGNAPAAARQNMANSPTEDVSQRKRAAAEEGDASASTKRLKVREELDEPAEIGAEDRQVHYPPPPGAQLETTAHHHSTDTPATSTPATPAAPTNTNPNKRAHGQPYEEPFKYLAPSHQELEDITKFYGLSPRFPKDRYMVRNATGQPVKCIYYTSALAREILTENEGKGMKFVHCGVRMFVKQDVQNSPEACKWRIQSEGLPIVEMWIGDERVVKLNKKETLHRLLLEMFPKFNGPDAVDLAEIGERVKSRIMGCCVLQVEPSNEPDGFEERLVMPLWRGIGSLNLMLPKEDRKAMLLRLYNDNSELVDHSKGSEQGTRNGVKKETDAKVKVEREDDDRVKAEDEEGMDIDIKTEHEGADEKKITTEPKDEDEDEIVLKNKRNVQSGNDTHHDRNGNFANPNKDAVLGKLESDLKMDPSAEVDDEADGGVSLETKEEQAAAIAAAQNNVMKVEDLVQSKIQNNHDETRATAAGITDEKDEFNKTV